MIYGLKLALVQIIQEELANDATLLDKITPGVLDNIYLNEFNAGTQWELIKQDGDEIE